MTTTTNVEQHGNGHVPVGPGRPLRVAMIGLRGIPASYGGVERAVEELAATLATRGHDVTVYARAAYSPADLHEHRGVRIRRLPQINTKHLEAASHTTLALAHAIRAREFDVVHLHATGPGAMSPIVRAAGIPVVVTIQGLDWRREKWGPPARAVLRAASSLAVRGPHEAIVVSRELQRYYRDELSTETTYIPNGVKREPVTEADQPVESLTSDGFVLFLGRLVPEKHVHTLIAAYRAVPGDAPLVIAGPDSHSPEYVARLHEMARQDPRVRMIGPRYGAEKAWLLHNASAFVQPSSIEGLPIALLEALSASRFPIVSEIPENLEPVTVDGERLGLSFPVGDDAALAEAIGHALGREDRAQVGERLARHVDDTYDWTTIAERTEEVYARVMTRVGPRSRVSAR